MNIANTVWKVIFDQISEEGPRLICGVPADEPELLDIAASNRAPLITFRDQRLAAYAATGWSRVTDRASILALQAGPGFFAALPGISEASSMRQPLVVLVTANPASSAERGGFQEVDVHGGHRELFTWRYHVSRPELLRWAIRTALGRAEGIHSGPVLLSIDPAMVWDVAVDDQERSSFTTSPSVPVENSLESAAAILNSAIRPVVIFGGGASRSPDQTLYANFVNLLDAGVLMTASGRGVYSEYNNRFLGLVGLYADANLPERLGDVDVVIIIGSQLEETARTSWPFPTTTRIIQIDHDSRVFDRSSLATHAMVGDASSTLLALCERIHPKAFGNDWGSMALERSQSYVDKDITALLFWTTLECVLHESKIETVLTQENGLADLWGYYAPAFRLPAHVRSIVPAEQTSMGFGVGAALGAAVHGNRVIAVCGDGAIEANLSALLTAVEFKLDVLFVVLRNRLLGWPSLSRPSGDSITSLNANRDLVSFAMSMGFKAGSLSEACLLPIELRSFIDGSPGPRLLEISIAGRQVIPGAAQS